MTPTRFIRRFLLYILPRGFHRIRHYGLLAGGSGKTNLARARELLDVAAPPDDTPDEPGGRPATLPVCGRMIVIEVGRTVEAALRTAEQFGNEPGERA